MNNEIYLYLEWISLADVLGIEFREAGKKEGNQVYNAVHFFKKRDIFLEFI